MKYINKLKIRESVFQKYDGHCAYCGKILNKSHFAIDHIEPRFRAHSDTQLLQLNRIRGADSIENFNPSCMGCNSSKSTYTIEKWRSEINKKHERLLKFEPSYNLLFRLGMIEQTRSCIFYFEKHKANL